MSEKSEKSVSFVIVAGGKGSRMGGEKKQFMLLNGRPLWRWSYDLLPPECVKECILVIPQGITLNHVPEKLTVPLKIAYGGKERAESVLNGLKEAACDYVLVHDAARPFLSLNLIHSLIDATDETHGAVPVLPVSDALKKIDGDNISCINRDGLYITQTPQSFPREKLIYAVSKNPGAKDEAEAWKKCGHELRHVKGERLNFKVTWPEDMMIARALTEGITRTGTGYDIHRLVPERKLILGGIEIYSPLGLLGHSDADLLTHSVMDAILGAAGLPDIGNLFPASDERFRGADSIELLREVMRMISAEGWHVEFVDAVVKAQVPRLNAYRDSIIAGMKRFFEFNVKFKSAEHIDDSGDGLSMSCWAAATLRRSENECR